MRALILAFVGGVWGLQQLPALPSWEGSLLIPLLACVAWPAQRAGALWLQWAGRGLMLAAALLAGFFWAAGMAEWRLSDDLPAAWEGRDIRIVGVVAELPQLGERGERFLFDVERVETPGARVPARIALTRYFAGFRESVMSAPRSQFRPGERWRLTVRLKQPHGNYNPHGFDFEAWALERNIRATGYLRKAPDNVRLAPFVQRPAYGVERIRESVRARFQRVLGDGSYEGILRALAIGDDSAISAAQWQVFQRTGVVHLMSISGLHVTMLAGLAFAVTAYAWRRSVRLMLWLPARKAGVLAGLFTAAGYAVLAGFAVPTQRTLYMLAVVALALWSGRMVGMSLVLGWALLTVVVLDPWAVLAPGFWLSFGAVGLLAYAGSARLQRVHWLREAVRSQWVITLGLTPLLLVLFQQVSLVSPLANALAIPLVSLVVTPLTLLAACVPVDAILHLAHEVMAVGMQLLTWCARWPAAVWAQHAPPFWTVLLALAGVLWMLLPRGFPLRWMGLAALVPMFVSVPAVPLPGQMHVTVLDVGQGLAVVVRTARHTLLYDAGSRFSSDTDSGNRIILPYLRAVGVTMLDGMVLSHDDIDHTGGAASVLQGLPVGWLASSLAADHPLRRETRQTWDCQAGQSWVWDGVRFDMLYPTAERYADLALADNAHSCVLKVSSPYGSLLLPADIERADEAMLVRAYGDRLAADVLLAPHHGSKTSSTADFLDRVRPALAVFTVGYRNRFGHPKPEVVARYRDLGVRVLRSDADGAVLLDFSADGIHVRTWRREADRYWLWHPPRVAENGATG